MALRGGQDAQRAWQRGECNIFNTPFGCIRYGELEKAVDALSPRDFTVGGQLPAVPLK